MPASHPLHRVVGDAIAEANLLGCRVLKDRECGGDQTLPLFCCESKSNSNEYCDVDLLILETGTSELEKIRVIVEIEEANVKPLQIFGKFLSCALSHYYIHEQQKNGPIPMADSVLLVQVLDVTGLKLEKTSKERQWRNIEHSIRGIIPLKGSKIDEYKLVYGDSDEFAVNGVGREEILNCIRTFLKPSSLKGS